MRKGKIILIIVGLVVILVSAVISYAKLFLPPRQWEMQLYFLAQEKHLSAFVDEFENYKELRSISIIGDSIWVNTFEQPDLEQELDGEVADKFKELYEKAWSRRYWKIENGILAYIWGGIKFGRRFNFSYISRAVKTSVPDCRHSLVKEDFGECKIQLNDRWELNYQWTPEM